MSPPDIPSPEPPTFFTLAVSEHTIESAPLILLALWLGAAPDEFERRRRIAMIQSSHSTKH